MKTKDAKLYGKEFASDILKYGDFTEEEKSSEDLFCEAFCQIVDNRQQYDDYSYFASLVNSKKNSETLWDAFESGISESLEHYINQAF